MSVTLYELISRLESWRCTELQHGCDYRRQTQSCADVQYNSTLAQAMSMKVWGNGRFIFGLFVCLFLLGRTVEALLVVLLTAVGLCLRLWGGVVLVVVGGGGMLRRLTGVGGALSERGLDIPAARVGRQDICTKQKVKQARIIIITRWRLKTNITTFKAFKGFNHNSHQIRRTTVATSGRVHHTDSAIQQINSRLKHQAGPDLRSWFPAGELK